MQAVGPGQGQGQGAGAANVPGVRQWLLNIPPITRAWVVISVATSIAVVSNFNQVSSCGSPVYTITLMTPSTLNFELRDVIS